MKNEIKHLTEDEIAGMRLQASKRKKRFKRTNICDDCGQPTDNLAYCDNCELYHLQFSGRI